MIDIFAELRRHAEQTPGSLALGSLGGHINYRTFAGGVDAVALHAASRGVKAEQPVLVDVERADARLLLTLGLMRIGAVVGFGRLRREFRPYGVAVETVITEDPKAPEDGRTFRLTPEWFQPKPGSGIAPTASDYALMLFSSGSTGTPKLVKFSKANVDYRLSSKGEDKYFSDLPIYYSTAGTATISTIADFFLTLAKGGLVIHSSDRSAKGILNTISLFRPNYVTMAPAMLVRVLRRLRERPRQLEKIAYLRLTGSYCSVENREEATRLLAREAVTSFGATEIGRVAWGTLADTRALEGSVGRIIPGIEIETVDDDGHPLPEGVEGEVRIKVPEAAAACYPTPAGDQSPLRDGWFYPGDIGRVDADGNFVVTGRKSLVINLGGNKVSPERAESVLQRMEGVEDVGIVGVKDSNGFDVVCAVLVGEDDVNLEGINKFIRANRANFMVEKLKFVSAIPRSESGKIERERLKELAASSAGGV